MRLPQNLLRVRRRRGRIRPLYASKRELSLAELLISIYREHIDEKRWRLWKTLIEVETASQDPKLVRGLSTVLDGHCIYQMRSLVDPLEARRLIFKLSRGRGVTSNEERLQILSEASSLLDISIEDLDESLYADLEEEHYLADFEPPKPIELLREYNLSLTVSLLTYAESIEIRYRGPPEELERLCQPLGEPIHRHVDGEFHISVRLLPRGRCSSRAEPLERLLRALLSMTGWSLWAEIRYPRSGRTYGFEFIGERDGWLLPSTGLSGVG